MPGSGYALPPAPPPELAPDAWAISAERLRQAGARRLCLTHGGPFDDVDEHLEQLMPNLDEVEEICRAAMLAGADDDEVTAFIQAHTEERIGPDARRAGDGRALRLGLAELSRRSDSAACSRGGASRPARTERPEGCERREERRGRRLAIGERARIDAGGLPSVPRRVSGPIA